MPEVALLTSRAQLERHLYTAIRPTQFDRDVNGTVQRLVVHGRERHIPAREHELAVRRRRALAHTSRIVDDRHGVRGGSDAASLASKPGATRGHVNRTPAQQDVDLAEAAAHR
jgi:hypothetical protein